MGITKKVLPKTSEKTSHGENENCRRTQVVHLRKMGKKIRDQLLEENIKRKLSEDHYYKWINEMMLENNELSAPKLQIMFNQKWSDVKASVSMIKRARLKLG